jgi:hypothetical protein
MKKSELREMIKEEMDIDPVFKKLPTYIKRAESIIEDWDKFRKDFANDFEETKNIKFKQLKGKRISGQNSTLQLKGAFNAVGSALSKIPWWLKNYEEKNI